MGVRTKGRCGKCGAIIESKHRHDFVSCPCDHFFLDGGTDYQRIGLHTDKEDPNSPTCLWNCETGEWVPFISPEPETNIDFDEIIPLYGEIK